MTPTTSLLKHQDGNGNTFTAGRPKRSYWIAMVEAEQAPAMDSPNGLRP